MSAESATAFRLCFGALHVVMQPGYRQLGHTLATPGSAQVIEEHIDWAATMQLRREMDAFGIGIAEAMDTAQRFFLGWPAASRLITETGALRLSSGFCAGAGADQCWSAGYRKGVRPHNVCSSSHSTAAAQSSLAGSGTRL